MKPKNKRTTTYNIEASNSDADAKPNAYVGPMFTTEEYNQIIVMLL